MLTGEIRNKVDTLWSAFWTGGIANPLTVIPKASLLTQAVELIEDISMGDRDTKGSRAEIIKMEKEIQKGLEELAVC